MKLKNLLTEGTYSPQQTQVVNKMLPTLKQQRKDIETMRVELEKLAKEDRRFEGYVEYAEKMWNVTNATIIDLEQYVIQGKV